MLLVLVKILFVVSLVPRPSLNLPAFNVARKSWEIERGPGDEMIYSKLQLLCNMYYIARCPYAYTTNYMLLYKQYTCSAIIIISYSS
jgi:hypothetical protein